MNSIEILDRRKTPRMIVNSHVVIRGLSQNEQFGIGATLLDLSKTGGRVKLDRPFDRRFRPKNIDVTVASQAFTVPMGQVRFDDRRDNLIFKSSDGVMDKLYDAIFQSSKRDYVGDRRISERRSSGQENNINDKRAKSRRISDLYSMEFEQLRTGVSRNVQIPFLGGGQSYDVASIRKRREWFEERVGKSLSPLGDFSEDPDEYRGNIENMIGVTHIPVGIAGPLQVNGQFAKGNFYVPMATTEGVLVNSYTLGMYLLTRSGGVTVRTLTNEMSISPIFIFSNVRESIVFAQWIRNNFQKIKEWAESTTNHGRLIRLEPRILARHVAVRFVYETEDAMGLNMICKATERACVSIRPIVKPQEYYLRSNFESDKKVSSFNFHNTYGKSLIAEAVIPKALLAVLRTDPQEIVDYAQTARQAEVHAGMIGSNGQFANGLTAVFIACGQDVAHVVNSHVGVTSCAITPAGDLYLSAYIPNLLVGTVGGGTNLSTSRANLEIMECFGPGKANKFAEIVAATLLAGEISISVSLVNGTYVEAHEKFGRNRPK